MHKGAVFLFLILMSGVSIASTKISCNNREYAGAKLDFFQYSDPVTKTTDLVFSLVFDQNGKSSAEFNTTITDYVFCDFGVYRGMLFLEPDKAMELLLPPNREKSFADQKNPYFTPVSFWIKTKNEDQLNDDISNFTQQFNFLNDKYFNQLYFRQSKEIYDSLVYFIDRDFGKINSPAFLLHKNMKLKMLEMDAFRQKPEQNSALFSTISTQFWMHPAFIDIFDKTFTGQLSFEVKSIGGNQVGVAVNKGDVIALQNFVKTKYNLSGAMVDLVILKLLHDGFYSGDFSKNAIKKMVESPVFKNHSNPIIKRASLNIIDKFVLLQQGTAAPVICLKNLEQQQICTNSTTDKFKYIVFADVEMIVCREQLKYLFEIDKRFNKYLEIFVVLRNTNRSGIQTFLAENEIPGKILIDENNEFIEKYKVRSFPQSFLLNEKHVVQFESTKSPLDGFEQQFNTFLRNELFMRQRNQSK